MIQVKDKFNRPLRDLRLSVTDRCNFRCNYCMPATQQFKFMKKQELLTFEEIERFVKIIVQLGVEKIKITGGEPLIRKDLEVLVTKIKAIPEIKDLALVTNGVQLPEKAQVLRDAGLDRITVSLDSLDPDNFLKISGDRGSVDEVLNGIQAAKDAGFGQIKINTVIQKDINENAIIDIAKFGRDNGHIIRYIEFMDVGNVNKWDRSKVVTSKETLERIYAKYPLSPIDPNYRGEVAKRYAYDDSKGEIGLISSISQAFCGDCHRGRISSDGQFYKCLFASKKFDCKVLLRKGLTDKQILRALSGLWEFRDDRYSALRLEQKDGGDKAEMFQIGG